MKGLKRAASVFLSLCMAATPLGGAGVAYASSNGGASTNVALAADGAVSNDSADTAVEAPINVKKIPGLSEDFIHGIDVSTYLSEIQSGVKYKDENGVEKNMFEIFKEGGANWVRLRVWNCPYRVDSNGKILFTDDAGTEYNEDQVTKTQHKDGYFEYALTDSGKTVYPEGYGAGNCDIDTAVATGKIATDYGMKVLIDFHYSDFWADPSKMKAPKAWTDMDVDTKAQALSDYTSDCLKKLKDGGVDVGMVQVGNEINGGMAGETEWDNIAKLLDAGTKAVRAADSKILIAIHYANPDRENYQMERAKALADAKIDYDVFASSYYSFWHGSTENLTNVLSGIAKTYQKKVMVAEVSYCTTLEDGDGHKNVVSADTPGLNYSIDAQGEGQAGAVRDAIAAVAAVGDAGIGTFYWEPAWVPVQNYADASNKEAVLNNNIDKWEKYGCGWASKWSGPVGDQQEGEGYDPGVKKDQSTHGSEWDNQAMFDFNGKALPSINVYKWVYTGASGPVRAASVDTLEYSMQYKEMPTLPDQTTVRLNNEQTVENVPVTWDASQVEALKTADFGEYVINGSLGEFSFQSKGETVAVAAGEWQTTCTVTVTGTNYVVNGSFEDGETGWTTKGDVSFKTDGAGGNAKDGSNYYQVYGVGGQTIDFDIEQTIDGQQLPTSGKYMLFGYYQGTNVGTISEESGLIAEVTYKDGSVRTYKGEIQVPGTWKVFYQAKAKDILINENVESIKITSRMISNNGGWAVVDDINLMQTDGADSLTAEEKAFGAQQESAANPGRVKKPVVKNTKKNTLKVSYKKVAGVEGYEIRYASKANMKGAKKVTTKKLSRTIKDKAFKAGSTYYVQVRAYTSDDAGKKVYSKSYSPKAKVQIQK